MDQNSSTEKGNSKNWLVIAAFVILVIAILAVAVVRLRRLGSQYATNTNLYSNTQNYNPTSMAVPTAAMSSASKDTSNAQLDKDLQDAQGNLDKLNNDLNNVDQGLSNTSQDTPQQ